MKSVKHAQAALKRLRKDPKWRKMVAQRAAESRRRNQAARTIKGPKPRRLTLQPAPPEFVDFVSPQREKMRRAITLIRVGLEILEQL